MSKRKSATMFDFFFFFDGGGLSGAKMVMMARHVNDGETCGTVLQYWQAESVKYDTCFQKSSYLPWRLKFGHLGASGYQIYFSVYRVDPHPFYKGTLDTENSGPHPFSNLYVSYMYIHFWCHGNVVDWHPIALLIYHFTYFQPEDIPIFSILFCKYKCTTWKSEEPHPL